MSLVGIAVEILAQHDFAMDCVLTGMLSGLSSIGLYSLFKKWLQSEISKKKENKQIKSNEMYDNYHDQKRIFRLTIRTLRDIIPKIIDGLQLIDVC